jgi:hypothetical protein
MGSACAASSGELSDKFRNQNKSAGRYFGGFFVFSPRQVCRLCATFIT